MVNCRLSTFVLPSLLILVFSSYCYGDIEVLDDTGRVIRLPHSAKKIISLAPHITELLFSAGAGNLIVGTVEYSDFPKPAQNILRIGTHNKIDLESVLELEPDLIVAWQSGNPSEEVESLMRLGMPVFISEPKKLEDIALNIKRFGNLTGNNDTAKKSATEFYQSLRQLRRKYSHRKKLRVFYQIWNEPLLTINGDHLISNIIDLCGGHNIFSELLSVAPHVSIESVLAYNPDVIIASGEGNKRPAWLDKWRKWPSLKAVKQDHLFFIPPDIIVRHTVRVLDGASRMCAQLESAR